MKKTQRYRLIRDNEVDRRAAEREIRQYYCNKDIDLVVTRISRRHVEPAHLHTRNIETYYVVKGRLNMRIGRDKIVLNAGDLATVFPGVAHSFSTGKKEVRFLAIKKYPLLKDKKLC